MSVRPMWIALYGISLLLWLSMCALGIEVWERLRFQFKTADSLIAEAEKLDMAIYEATAPRPPAEIATNYPVVCDLDNATDAAFLEAAQRWDALILRCDIKGHIEQRFATTRPGTVADLASKAAGVANLPDLLREEDQGHRKDAVRKIQEAAEDFPQSARNLQRLAASW